MYFFRDMLVRVSVRACVVGKFGLGSGGGGAIPLAWGGGVFEFCFDGRRRGLGLDRGGEIIREWE